jgi:cytochrome c biogenesis protein CcdA
MEFLQNILDNSNIPIVTAFVLGLLTAISPCPLATNITAIGYIGRDIESKKRIFWNGILIPLGVSLLIRCSVPCSFIFSIAVKTCSLFRKA